MSLSQPSLSRRSFLAAGLAGAASASLLAPISFADHHKEGEKKGSHDGQPYKISLAQWSLHRTIRAGDLDPLDFPVVARKEFDIDGVEYVNQFFKDKASNRQYLGEMKQKGADNNVEHVLIMVDGEGNLGDPDNKKRRQAVQNHIQWLDAAKFLGCHSIRVNAASSGSWDQQRDLAADGLRQLGEEAEQFGLNVLVENHGGLSSNGAWLSSVMKYADHPLVGTLPDFGNFIIDRKTGESYDRYQGMKDLMPYAKAVSAKSYSFDDEGKEPKIDFSKMIGIMLDHGYHNWVGIEWEGSEPDEYAGIRLTKDLLMKVRESAAA